jgi:hypothetical protein
MGAQPHLKNSYCPNGIGMGEEGSGGSSLLLLLSGFLSEKER